MIPSDTWRMRRFLSLFQSFHKTPWRLLQCCWFVLRLQEKICNFSRNKLRRRHFSRKVLKAEAAFLLALFPSFWKTPLKLLLWSSFFNRLEEVLDNFCRNGLLCTTIFFETSWRQKQFFYLFCFKDFGEVFRPDYSGALF